MKKPQPLLKPRSFALTTESQPVTTRPRSWASATTWNSFFLQNGFNNMYVLKTVIGAFKFYFRVLPWNSGFWPPEKTNLFQNNCRHVLGCGTFRLVYDGDQEVLWIGAAEGKKKDSFEAKGPLEVFGFRSGDFLEGPNAKDVQVDLTGRWLSFAISSTSDYCILEADRRLPDHIKKIDIFGKVCWLDCWNHFLWSFSFWMFVILKLLISLCQSVIFPLSNRYLP